MSEFSGLLRRPRWTPARAAALAFGIFILVAIVQLWRLGLSNALGAHPFLILFGLLAILVTALTLTGVAVVAAFNIRLAARPTPESAAVWLFLGTGTWALVFGWFSYAGCNAHQAVVGAGAVGVLLLLVLAIQRRLAWLAMPIRLKNSLPLLAVMIVGAVVAMAPLLRGSSINPHGDAALYISTAEYLQFHDFGTPAPLDPYRVINQLVANFQNTGHRMGSMFLLAMVRALFPQMRTMEIYPALLALGTILNLGGVYVLCRWLFRLPASYAIAAVLMMAVMPNPLWCSTYCSFFSQVYGTASLAFCLGIVSRLSSPGRWRFDSAVLFGLAGAILITMYNELSPFLAIVCCGYFVSNWRRARRAHRLRRFLGFAGMTLLTLLLLGNVEYPRLFRGVLAMLRLNGCGWQLHWNDIVYWAFAMGTKSWPASGDALVAWATVPATAAFFVGLRRTFRYRPAFPIAIAIVVFACLVGYYRFVAHDPWTGATGHTWNLFKLCKWAFPLVMAIQAAGLYDILCRRLRPRLLLVMCCAVSVLISVPIWKKHTKRHYMHVKAWANFEPTYIAVRELQRQVDELGVKQVCLIHEPEACWPEFFVPYMLHPLPVANNFGHWSINWGGGYSQWWESTDASAFKETFFLVQGDLPFEQPLRQLPTSLSVVSPDHPLVCKVGNINGVQRNADGEGSTWVGTQPVVMWVWSPRPGKAVLTFAAAPGPSLPETQRRHLRIKVAEQDLENLDFAAPCRASLPLSLAVGVTRVEVLCPDSPTLQVLPDGDRRICLVSISNVEVGYSNESQERHSGGQ